MKELEYNEAGFLKHIDPDLKASYRGTYRLVKESIRQGETEAKAEEKRGRETEHRDTRLKKGIIEDLNIAINQMHTGRPFGSKKGAHRKRPYKYEKEVDPLYVQMYKHPTNSRSGSTLTDHQKTQLAFALSRLTQPERDCYEMAYGDCLSFSDIADRLKISKGSVQKNVERARKKVAADVHGNQADLFLQEFCWEREEESESEE